MLRSVGIYLLEVNLAVFVSLKKLQVLRLPKRIVIQASVVRLLLAETLVRRGTLWLVDHRL